MKKKNLKFIIIGIVLVIAIALGVTILVIKFNKKDDNLKKEITYSDATPLLYKVSDENSSIYLLGSIHVADDSAYEFNQKILDIYNKADALAVECDIVDFQKDLNKQLEILKDYLYMDGTTIKDHIDEELYEKMVNLLKEKKLYNEVYEVYNISMWDSFVSEVLYKDANLDETKGIDMYFLNKAKEDKKRIIEVESVEFQMNLEKDIPEKLAIFSIEQTIDYYDESVEMIKALYEAWKKGDEEELEKILTEEDTEEFPIPDELKEDYENYYNKKMVTDRNIGMADVMEENLENDTEVFCVVGAAHVIGDEGIAALLKERGYTVEKVNYA